MFYLPFFKGLIGKQIIIELKNDMVITGILSSVDQYMNFKLNEISVDIEKFPHMLSTRNSFVRGSCISFIQLPLEDVNLALIQENARKEHGTSLKKIC
ncbi:U6 snRNA-associated Sm-like protein LSm2 [Intoshia linei]|uniref:U6 snRNA-associated Sm-like protein LSm2 n=1 Tax=Intoshia linei TaxID=1819745 RepID=A0A177AXY3_9BILA|nr:U6 snRNA-associated Sm-like protein LSm2 [Intoshia linei]